VSKPSTDACSDPLKPSLANGLPWLWATADAWAEVLTAETQSDSESRLHTLLKWDPGHVSQRLWSTPRPSTTGLALPETLWTLKTTRQAAAVTKLFQSGLALGLAIQRLAEENSFHLPASGMEWSIWLQGPLWVMAAHSSDDFADWLDTPESVFRQRIETKILGLRATLWSQWNLAQFGQDTIARFLWTTRGHSSTDLLTLSPKTSGPDDLLAILEQAHAIYGQSRFCLNRTARSDTSMKDPRVALLEAQVLSLSKQLTVAPPDDNRLVKRTLSLIRSSHQARTVQDRFQQASQILESISRDANMLLSVSKQHGSDAATPQESIIGISDPGLDASPREFDFKRLQNQWKSLQAHWWEMLGKLDDWSEEMGKRHCRSESQAQAGRFESLAEFAAGAGHELNNPLAVIQGRAQLLLAKATDETIRSSLKAIVDQSLRAHRMLRDLIFIARPTDLRPRFSRPSEIVRTISRELKEEVHQREIRLDILVCPQAQRLETDQIDPDAFRHMTLSLVRNAIEASQRGGQVRVSLRLEPQSLRLTVEDEGQGFDLRESNHLFDPFYCGRKAGRGLGLGLPRLARIVAQMNGRVRYRSQPDRGSVFEAVLPLFVESQIQTLSTSA